MQWIDSGNSGYAMVRRSGCTVDIFVLEEK